MGWSVLVVDLPRRCRASRWRRACPAETPPKRGSIQAGSDGRSLILSALDGGARDRSAAELDTFFAAACGYAAQLNEG